MHPLYNLWRNMNQRCVNPKHVSYPRYGAVGIRVCERWQTFENFVADMGARPKGKQIDRVDGRKDYEPGNCRWATPTEQQRNRLNNRLITIGGDTKTMAEWSVISGIAVGTIRKRLDLKWPADTLLSAPTPSAPLPACRRGHAATPENSYMRPNGDRDCRICRRAERVARSSRTRALSALSGLESVKVADEWQPIKTAPKDGTKLLAVQLGDDVETVMEVRWDAPKNDLPCWVLTWNNEEVWPDFWRPLPNSPAIAQLQKVMG